MGRVKFNIAPMQSGPMELWKTKEPFMYENKGSRIFINGKAIIPKTEAFAMGIHGIEYKPDKSFVTITYNEYIEAMSHQGKSMTVVFLGDKPETVD